MTDKALVKGCLRADPKCQKELFRLYSGKMLFVCMRYTRHKMEAEDILQDAFIKVFENIDKFKFKGSLEGWIRRIVVNTALKNYNKKSFQNEQLGLEVQQDQPVDPTIDSSLDEAVLLKLVSRLPDGYRIVFNLYAIEGYSHKEIAEMIGIQESTSRSQLVKARKMLQNQILNLEKITTT
ncbi:MAG: sigma-70 family RNA polymerase sigma factor [Bacteroidota bacterium]